MKKLNAILLTILLAVPASAQKPRFVPFAGNPVIDAAGVIPDTTEARLNRELTAFWHLTERQLVIATTPSLEGRDIESYANDYFRFLGVGTKKLDNGVLFLHALRERKMRLEVGYGLEGVLTDAEAFKIIEYGVKPHFKAGDFPTGYTVMTAEVLKRITPDAVDAAKRRAASEPQASAEHERESDTFLGHLLGGLSIVGIGLLLGWLLIKPALQRRRKQQEMADREKEALRRKLQAEQDALDRLDRVHQQPFSNPKEAEWECIQNEREEIARQAHIEMLANETESQRAARVFQEALEREEQRKHEKEEAEARRRASVDSPYGWDSTGNFNSGSSWGSSSSFDSGFSGGGGDSGGGGASSDY